MKQNFGDNKAVNKGKDQVTKSNKQTKKLKGIVSLIPSLRTVKLPDIFQVATMHMKRWSTSYVIRKLKSKTMRYIILTRIANRKKLTKLNAGEYREQQELSFCWECKMVQPLWQTV